MNFKIFFFLINLNKAVNETIDIKPMAYTIKGSTRAPNKMILVARIPNANAIEKNEKPNKITRNKILSNAI